MSAIRRTTPIKYLLINFAHETVFSGSDFGFLLKNIGCINTSGQWIVIPGNAFQLSSSQTAFQFQYKSRFSVAWLFYAKQTRFFTVIRIDYIFLLLICRYLSTSVPWSSGKLRNKSKIPAAVPALAYLCRTQSYSLGSEREDCFVFCQ